MRLLVTGGAGFIGANFVHRTLQERSDVSMTALDAFTYAGSRESLAGLERSVRVVEGDIADQPLVSQLVALADPEPFLHSNVVGTFSVLEAVRRHGVRLHHVSTDEVYGDLPLDVADRF